MSTTNRNSTFIIAGIAALNIPLPFEGYLKPEIDWKDKVIPEYYTLNEIDKTALLGSYVDIRKDEDNLYFIYSDSSLEFDDGHYDAIRKMGEDLGIEVRIMTSQTRYLSILNNTAGIKQIGNWVYTEVV